MFWRKYSASEVVTTGNALGGTMFALSVAARAARRSRDERSRDVLVKEVIANGERQGKASPQPHITLSAHEPDAAPATKGRNLERW